MFAYCENNPIIFQDEAGDAPWSAIWPDWGFVHRKVQEHLVTRYSWLRMETRISLGVDPRLNRTTWGRADLSDANGNIWEIKYCGAASLYANSQLERYESGIIYNTMHPTRGNDMFFGGFFQMSRGGLLYVSYWSTESGVILYDFELLDVPTKATSAEPSCAKSPIRYIPVGSLGKVGKCATLFFAGLALVYANGHGHASGKYQCTR